MVFTKEQRYHFNNRNLHVINGNVLFFTRQQNNNNFVRMPTKGNFSCNFVTNRVNRMYADCCTLFAMK